MLNRVPQRLVLLSGVPLMLCVQLAAAQQPVVYRPPPPAAAAPAGTLPLANLPAGARDAIMAGIAAMQTWSFAQADEHFAHALSIDSTIGLARVLRIHMRNWNINAADFVRGSADAARRGMGEQTVALAYRANGAVSAALFAAAVVMFPNDQQLKLEHASALAGAARLDSLRSLNRQLPDFAPSRMYLAYFLTLAEEAPAPEVAEEALAAAREAVRLAPNVAGPHVAMGHVLERMLRHDEAAAHLTAALRLDPKHPIAYELLAEIYLHDGAPRAVQRARAALDSAAAYTIHSHHRYELLRHSSQLQLHEGNFDAVVAHDTALIREAQSRGFTDFTSVSWMRLAVLAGIAGRPQLIDGFIAEARKVYPTPTVPMLNLETHAYELARRPDDARRARDAWVQVANPAPNALTFHNALILLADNKPAEALAECATLNNPNLTAQLWCGLVGVEAELARGRRTQAEQLRRAAVARKDNPVESLVLTALVYRGRSGAR